MQFSRNVTLFALSLLVAGLAFFALPQKASAAVQTSGASWDRSATVTTLDNKDKEDKDKVKDPKKDKDRSKKKPEDPDDHDHGYGNDDKDKKKDNGRES